MAELVAPNARGAGAGAAAPVVAVPNDRGAAEETPRDKVGAAELVAPNENAGGAALVVVAAPNDNPVVAGLAAPNDRVGAAAA